jgi:predicted nucleic acid-binding protein
LKLYLDTSTWLKRYLPEEGSPEMDLVFEKAGLELHKLVASLWNVGECLCVFDRRRRRGEINESEFKKVVQNFSSETTELVERGNFLLAPVSAGLLAQSWKIVLDEHMHQADALQLKTSITEACDIFLTADDGLATVAEKIGLDAIPIEKSDGQMKLRELLKG